MAACYGANISCVTKSMCKEFGHHMVVYQTLPGGAKASLHVRGFEGQKVRQTFVSHGLSDVRAKLQLSTGTGSFKDATDLTFLLDPCVLP